MLALPGYRDHTSASLLWFVPDLLAGELDSMLLRHMIRVV